LNHLPTLSNYRKLARAYKNALVEYFKGTGIDYNAEFVSYYFGHLSPAERKRLGTSYERFLQGHSFKRAYIEPHAFMSKTMAFYTIKTGKALPDGLPKLETTPKY